MEHAPDRGPDPVPFGHAARRAAAALLCTLALGLAGCATTASTPLLHAVGRAESDTPAAYAPATPQQQREGLRILRDGQPLVPEVGMALATGDRVESLAGTVAVIRFPDGHEAVLLPDTRVRLGSLIAEAGNLFVRVFERARDRFKVKTRYVTAGVEGTAFWVRVEPGDRLTVGVTEGRVVLSSVDSRWPEVPVLPDEVAVTVGDGPPSKAQVERAQLDAIVRQVSRLRLAAPMPRLPPR